VSTFSLLSCSLKLECLSSYLHDIHLQYTSLTLSDEPQPTFSAREIVLELFPATPEGLVPAVNRYHLEPDEHGNVQILTSQNQPLLTLEPVSMSGKPSTQVCCDFCQRSAPRRHLDTLRVEVPNSNGRRFFYVTRCKDHESCESRRFNDKPIRALLERVFDKS
jgi:hypothetical protein